MKPYSRYLFVLTAACVLGMAGAPVTLADSRDHDRARQALTSGEVLALRTILERVEKDHPGKVMEVELERKHGLWVYEIKVLRTDGALVKLKINAKDGALLERDERNPSRRRDGRSRGESR